MMCTMGFVRTNIVIDDDLMQEAMKASGAKTRRETVDLALREMVSRNKRRQILELQGIGWEGDLAEWRRDRDFD